MKQKLNWGNGGTPKSCEALLPWQPEELGGSWLLSLNLPNLPMDTEVASVTCMVAQSVLPLLSRAVCPSMQLSLRVNLDSNLV